VIVVSDPVLDLKKIRSISNANAVKNINMQLIMPAIDEKRGIPHQNFIKEKIAGTHMDHMFRYWYEITIDIWARRGITCYGEFLEEVERRGIDCSDKQSWEATTKTVGALLYLANNLMHVPYDQWEEYRDQIAALGAEYINPYIVLAKQGNVLCGMNRPGATESGNDKTLDGNGQRHLDMHHLFSLTMDAWFRYDKAELYAGMHAYVEHVGAPPQFSNAEEAMAILRAHKPGKPANQPPIHASATGANGIDSDDDDEDDDVPHCNQYLIDELVIDKECKNILGDDYAGIATAFSDYKARWIDYKHGTTTKGCVKDAFVKFDEDGEIMNDPADYLRTHFVLVKPTEDKNTWYVGTCRSPERTLAKLLQAPHDVPTALAATIQAMYICGYKALYDKIRYYYDLLLKQAEEMGDEVLRDVQKHMADEDYVHLPTVSSLKPPSWEECQAFMAPDIRKALSPPKRVAYMREYAATLPM